MLRILWYIEHPISVYNPAVQNNTIIADRRSAHKLHSILPKFLPQTPLISLQKYIHDPW